MTAIRKKSKTQLKLERVEMIDSIVQNKLIEQRQWRDLALSITANMGGERVQSSGSKSRMADALNKCVDMEDTIARQVDKLAAEKQKIVSAIERLDSPFEYRVLHCKYLQYKTLEEIAEMMNKSYTSITTAHGRALVSLSKILENRGD